MQPLCEFTDQDMAKRERKILSLKQKVEFIKQKESAGRSQRELANQFGIGKTQVQVILKRKSEFLDSYESGETSDSRKRLSVRSPNEELNILTWEWFQCKRSQQIPISGPALQEKALEYAKQLKIDSFKASNGCLESFRRRHDIKCATICGESASVNPTTVSDWKDKHPTLVDGYEPRDIYNLDETGLFYRALPDRTLAVKSDTCKGEKRSKERITVSLLWNMAGD